jgi:anti-anti-sigma factor
MMSGLKISYDDTRKEVVLVELEGHLDAHTFEDLEKLFDGFFAQGRHLLMLDLNHLRYISSAGAGVLIGALGVCQENDGNIALIRPSAEVKEIFDLLGVFHIFPIASTAEEALAVLSG